MSRRLKRLIVLAPAAIVGILVFIAIGGAIVALLWNWLLPPLFGWPPLTFWQALGLLALCRILFGGLGRHGWHRSDLRRRMEHFTPEEREQMRQRIRARWGFGPSTSESKREPEPSNRA